MNFIKRLIINAFIVFMSASVFAHGGDTLKCHFETGTPHLYPSANGGFICGNNGFGDMEIAQKYGVDTALTPCAAEDSMFMSEILVWFGAKKGGNGNNAIVKVYSVNPTTGGPGSLLSTSFPTPVNLIDTSSTNDTVLTEFILQTPVTLTDSFFVSIQFPSGAGAADTLGVMSNTDGDGLGMKLAWTMDLNSTWAPIQTLRGLDIDLAIFPNVVEVLTGVNEAILQEKQVKAWPNPASSGVNISYELPKAAEVHFSLTDLNGKSVMPGYTIRSHAGTNTQHIETTSLAPGMYFYRLESEGMSVVKKLVIE